MSNSLKLEQSTAKKFMSVKKEIDELTEKTESVSNMLNTNISKSNKNLNEYNNELGNLRKEIELLGVRYDLIDSKITDIYSRLDQITDTLDSLVSKRDNHDLMTYDIMQKMIASQQSMIENVINLLKVHSIIDEAEMADELLESAAYMQSGDPVSPHNPFDMTYQDSEYNKRESTKNIRKQPNV